MYYIIYIYIYIYRYRYIYITYIYIYITKILVQEEKLPVTRAGVHDFLKRFEAYGCLLRKPGPGHPTKITIEVKRIVEAQMKLDDETTAQQLHALLTSKGYALSLNTILRCRSSLGWTFRGSAYYQLIRFIADNDPKHNSIVAREILAENGIYWWRTPAESPDLNPIENLWHELKEFIRREVKPKKKDELVDGIKCFWETVDLAKCRKYIRHIHKVIPKVIELLSAATGY